MTERSAAEWVLSTGGKVAVFRPAGENVKCDKVTDLPKTRFTVAEIDLAAASVIQAGVFGSDGDYRYFPDIAANQCGDAAVGYTKSNASIFPSVWATGRNNNDPLGSMQAEMDFGGKLNRLEVVKKVLSDFIEGDGKTLTGRSSDLVGLITFARYADTVCPLVLSHNVLLEFLKKTELVQIQSEDGTAIGDAIALAAARLKKAEEESVDLIVLGTHGRTGLDHVLFGSTAEKVVRKSQVPVMTIRIQ